MNEDLAARPGLAEAIERVGSFLDTDLSTRLARLEREVVTASHVDALQSMLARESIDDVTLRAALSIKEAAGQINVVIHALGILLALPHVLEPAERVESLSLGAGTGGKLYDLETDRRIAEFKFIRWRGQDSVRQDGLFADFVNLACDPGEKRRYLYVTGKTPKAFLETSGRSLASVTARKPGVLVKIAKAHGESIKRVAEFYAAHAAQVEVVDLEKILPAYELDVLSGT